MYDVENIHRYPFLVCHMSFSHEFAKSYSCSRYTQQHVYMAVNSRDLRVARATAFGVAAQQV